ncbi:MAG: DUF4149 domain-containing protein [Caldimonas sp.]
MSSEALRRLAAWLAGLWAGSMAGVGFIAAPALFAVLSQADAGRVASRLFERDAYVGLAAAALLFIVAMQRARLAAESGRGSRFSSDMLLALAALFCVVAGHFALQPMIESARAGGPGLSFAALHVLALMFFAGKLAAATALAWRLTAPATLPPPSLNPAATSS